MFLAEKSLVSHRNDEKVTDIFELHEYIYEKPRTLADVNKYLFLVAIRMVIISGLMTGLYFIDESETNRKPMNATGITLAVLLLIDALMVFGYCKRKPRVLLCCYILNTLFTVPALATLAFIFFFNDEVNHRYVGYMLLGLIAVYIGFHFVLHR